MQAFQFTTNKISGDFAITAKAVGESFLYSIFFSGCYNLSSAAPMKNEMSDPENQDQAAASEAPPAEVSSVAVTIAPLFSQRRTNKIGRLRSFLDDMFVGGVPAGGSFGSCPGGDSSSGQRW